MIDIYIYENLINGKVYVGQTNDLNRRNYEHVHNGNKTMPIDRAIKKYGRESFILSIITSIDTREQADYAEMDWIHRAISLLGKRNVYNVSLEANNPNGGRKPSKKSIEKNRLAHLGKKASEETKKKMSDARKGRTLSEEHKKNIAASKIGNKYSVGAVRSEESKRKLSEERKGIPLSIETRKKLSEALKGKPWSEARRAAHEAKKRKNLTNNVD
jgi:group I intron endonuclease